MIRNIFYTKGILKGFTIAQYRKMFYFKNRIILIVIPLWIKGYNRKLAHEVCNLLASKDSND